MSFFLYFFIILIGICFGSFLNVLADRIPRREKLTGRSHCEHCHKTLSWKDLIPLISFVYLRGKCRYCHHPLSYQYPLVELVTAILFAFTIYYLSITNSLTSYLVSSIYYLIMVSSLIVVFFADLKYGIIPDKIVFPAIIISLIWIATSHQPLAISYLLSAIGAFIFFLFIYLITKSRGIGFGDVKLALLIGLFLGFPAVLFAFYIAFLTGGIVGVILILWKKKTLKSAIPFGPFLVIGCVMGLFLQSFIIRLISPFL